MQPSEDDFLRWRDDPITRWVFDSLEAVAQGQKQHWIDSSWGQGACSPEMLLELRTRADAYRAIIEVSYARLCAVTESLSGDTKG